MVHVRNVIGGELVDAADGAVLQLTDPSTGEVYATSPHSSEEDVDRAYEAAVEGAKVWRKQTPAERQRALLRIADAVERRGDDFVEAEVRNTGKTYDGMRAELVTILEQLRFVAGAMRSVEGVSSAEYVPGHTSYLRREPVGIVGQVAAWNFPMMLAVWKFAPAVAMGNAVVLKPSDTTPVTATMLADIARHHLPEGVFNLVCGDRDTGRHVVAHPKAAMVSITGSTRAGLEVAAVAARDLKRAHLELGGNAPVVVLDDADLDAVVATLADGYYNAGQNCTAPARVLAQDGIADELMERLVLRVRMLVVGAPSDPEAYLGPLNNAAQLARIQGLFDRLPPHAEVLTGGRRIDRPGYFWEPTVVAGLRQADELVQTEVFGPVLTVQRFATVEEAIELANDTEYALCASVWTRDHGQAMRTVNDLDYGTIWVNAHDVGASEMPRGGFKHSGMGKELSAYGLEGYTRTKHVMHNLDV